MTFLRLLLAIALAPSIARAADPPAPRKLSLPELVRLAQERAKNVHVARAELAVRRAQKREAISAYAPFGDASFTMTGAPELQCRGPNNNADPTIRTQDCVRTVDPASGKSVSFLNFNIAGVGLQLGVNLVVPIYTFGKIGYLVDAAGHGIEAGEALVEAQKTEAAMNATRAYWGLKATRAALDTIKSGRDELEPWAEKIEKAIDEKKQKYTISDVQRIKVGLAQVDLFIADFSRNQSVAMAGLRALTGEELDIDETELDLVEIVDHPVDYYQEYALTHRPELRAVNHGVAAFQDLARMNRSQLLPDFGLTAGILWRYAPTIEDSQNAFDNKANLFAVGLFLGLRQPLDLYQRVVRWRRSRAEADVLANQRALLLTGIGFEIAQAHADRAEARQRVEVAERGQKIARGWLTAVQQSIDLGTGEPRDLVDAARQYFELRLRYYQAIHDANLATARLRRAAGMDIVR